jgi:aminoacylase
MYILQYIMYILVRSTVVSLLVLNMFGPMYYVIPSIHPHTQHIYLYLYHTIIRCIQYMEAIRKLHSTGFQPTRHVYLTFVPDEEIGGAGMAAFLDSKVYQELPGIALALDEGLASMDQKLNVFYGERMPWFVQITAEGHTGHGSRFIEHTAVEQLLALCQKALEFRQGQRAVLHGLDDHDHVNCSHAVVAAKNKSKQLAKNNTTTTPLKLGDVTSLNITTLQAGVRVADTYAYNVVPPQATASFDIRIPPHMPPQEMRTILDGWCQECSSSNTSTTSSDGPGKLSWSFVSGQYDDSMGHCTTSTDPKINPWYAVFASALHELPSCPFELEVFPAASDSRFLRALGVRALGFSPMRHSEIMLHENDEYIDVAVFLEGLGIMTAVIQRLAMQGPEMEQMEQAQKEEQLAQAQSTATAASANT